MQCQAPQLSAEARIQSNFLTVRLDALPERCRGPRSRHDPGRHERQAAHLQSPAPRVEEDREPTPLSGERLVCLKNDRAKHLFNGGTWTVEKVRKSNGTAVRMVVAPEDAGDARRSTEIKVHPYALRQLGFAKCERVDFDHDPALGLRPWDDEKQDFIPPQLDPDFIVIRTEPAHDKKTNGNGATSYGSDKHAIANVDRVGEVEEAFRRRLLAKSDPDIDAPGARGRESVPGIFSPAAASQKPQQLPQTRGMNSVAINKLMLSFATPVFQRLADGHWHNFLTHEAQAAATRKLATSSLH